MATAEGASASSATHRRGARAREARREARVATGAAWALRAERVAPVAAILFPIERARARLSGPYDVWARRGVRKTPSGRFGLFARSSEGAGRPGADARAGARE